MIRRGLALVVALVLVRWLPAWWCGRDAERWMRGDPETQRALAAALVSFERRDAERAKKPAKDRFAGEWALVTHQMTALGLAQLCLAHPEWRPNYAPVVTRAAIQSFRPEMRDFGTRAWHGEDALASLASSHGHAYLAYSALAIGMARLLDPSFPAEVAAKHDALRRLRAPAAGVTSCKRATARRSTPAGRVSSNRRSDRSKGHEDSAGSRYAPSSRYEPSGTLVCLTHNLLKLYRSKLATVASV